MKLHELQGLFWRAVRHDPMPPEIEQHFLDQGGLPARERMKIYQDAYWYRQVDALFDCFPKLAEALGPEVFTRTVCRYLTEHPSVHPVLELLGRDLGAFLLRQDDPALARLADLARLEHARLLALLAPRPRALATAADIDPDTFAVCRVEPSPALVALSLRRDALLRWTHPTDPADEPSLTPVVAWRKGHGTRHQALDPDEGVAFDLALRGASMAEIFDAFEAHPTPEQRAFQVLQAWLQRHWITAFLPPPPP